MFGLNSSSLLTCLLIKLHGLGLQDLLINVVTPVRSPQLYRARSNMFNLFDLLLSLDIDDLPLFNVTNVFLGCQLCFPN